MRRVTYELPFPPSVNGLFRDKVALDNQGGAGRPQTKVYRSWIKLASGFIMAQGIKHVPGWVGLQIYHRPSGNRRRDISNYVKAIEDLLVHCQIIEDDSKVAYQFIGWSDFPGTRVFIQEVGYP